MHLRAVSVQSKPMFFRVGAGESERVDGLHSIVGFSLLRELVLALA